MHSSTQSASSGIVPCSNPGIGSVHPGIFGATVASTRFVLISQRSSSHSLTRCAQFVSVQRTAAPAGVAQVSRRFGIGFCCRRQGCYCFPSWTPSTRFRFPSRVRSESYTHRQLSEHGERWSRQVDLEGRGTAGDGPAATSRTQPGGRSVSAHAPLARALFLGEGGR